MRKLRRTIAVTAVALVVAGLVPATAAATTQADTVAVAVNTKDGGSVFRLAFSIRRVMDETVDQDNAAVAIASCADCETVALAFQVVLVMSDDPDVVTTDNLAIALNTECSSCTTFASATQFVLGTDGVVRLTEDGQRRLAALRTKLLGLRREDLTVAELDAVIEAARRELKSILETELVVVQPEESDERAGTTASSSTTTTTSTPTSSSTTTSSTTSSSTSTTTTNTTTTTTAGN